MIFFVLKEKIEKHKMLRFLENIRLKIYKNISFYHLIIQNIFVFLYKNFVLIVTIQTLNFKKNLKYKFLC